MCSDCNPVPYPRAAPTLYMGHDPDSSGNLGVGWRHRLQLVMMSDSHTHRGAGPRHARVRQSGVAEDPAGGSSDVLQRVRRETSAAGPRALAVDDLAVWPGGAEGQSGKGGGKEEERGREVGGRARGERGKETEEEERKREGKQERARERERERDSPLLVAEGQKGRPLSKEDE